MAPYAEHRRRRPCRPRAGPAVRRQRRVRGAGRADPLRTPARADAVGLHRRRPRRRRRWRSCARADAWMLAVPRRPDRAGVRARWRRHAARWRAGVPLQRREVVGGAESAAAQAGALTASVHPVRSFADPGARGARLRRHLVRRRRRRRARWRMLEPALAAIGARLVPIDAAAKTVYHAASVFASNYLVTVIDAALRAYQAAGIPEAVARELAAAAGDRNAGQRVPAGAGRRAERADRARRHGHGGAPAGGRGRMGPASGRAVRRAGRSHRPVGRTAHLVAGPHARSCCFRRRCRQMMRSCKKDARIDRQTPANGNKLVPLRQLWVSIVKKLALARAKRRKKCYS